MNAYAPGVIITPAGNLAVLSCCCELQLTRSFYTVIAYSNAQDEEHGGTVGAFTKYVRACSHITLSPRH